MAFGIYANCMKARTNRWDDHFARQARSENWAARSVYKLEEIDLRFKILKQGDRVLDLGCFPGSWSQYALKKVGSPGRVVGVDTRGPLELPYDNFTFIKQDVFDLDPYRLAAESGKVDVVLSDMAPSTTGIRNTDAARSMELALRALEISMKVLSNRGRMVCKAFEGEDIGRLRNMAAAGFRDLRLLRPTATRKRSRELYLIGINFIKS